ncbi:MAG TPA: TraM recognition domain-containing protein [Chloroflexia bacterium]|nr:TraM recognition domain-containing protein [Chloroflexia bacterium]
MNRRTPPPPPDDDTGAALLVALIVGLGRGFWHISRRVWQQPVKGALWLLWLAGMPMIVRLAWGRGGAADRPWFADPVLVPRLEWAAFGLAVVFVVIVGLDRVRSGVLCTPWPWNRPPPPPRPPPVPRPAWNDRVLGRRVLRTWDPDLGAFVLQPTTEEFVFHDLAAGRLSKITVGPSGCGKTFSQLGRDALWIRRTQQHGVVIDPKGLQAQDYPREIFTHVFDPSNPASSFRWNIYGDLPPDQAAALLAICLIPRQTLADHAVEYFDDNAREACRAIFVAHVAATAIPTHSGPVPGDYPTLVELFDYLADKHALQALAERLPPRSTERRDLARQIRLTAGAGDPLGTLYNKLAPLARSRAVQLLAGPGEGVSLKDLVNRPGTLVGFALNLATQLEVGRILGRLALAMWTYTILDDAVVGSHFKLMICDESRDFLSSEDDLVRGMEKARSHNAGYSLAFQSTAQLVDERQTARFLNAVGIRVVFRNVDQFTAAAFSQNTGGAERVYHNRSLSSSTGASLGHTSGSSTAAGGHYQGRGRQAGSSISEASGYSESRHLRPDWLPAEIQQIPEHHALISINRTVPDPKRPGDITARRTDIALADLTDTVLQRVEEGQDLVATCGALGRPIPVPAVRVPDRTPALPALRAELRDLATEWAALVAARQPGPASDQQRALEARIEHLLAQLPPHHQPPPGARIDQLVGATLRDAAQLQPAQPQAAPGGSTRGLRSVRGTRAAALPPPIAPLAGTATVGLPPPAPSQGPAARKAGEV